MPASRCGLPCETARNAPAPSFSRSFSPRNLQPSEWRSASSSTARRYVVAVSRFGGSAVNQRATLLPSASACSRSSGSLGFGSSTETCSRSIGRGCSSVLNDGSLNEAGAHQSEPAGTLPQAVRDDLPSPREQRERRRAVDERRRDAGCARVPETRERALQSLRSGAVDQLVQLPTERQLGEHRTRRF